METIGKILFSIGLAVSSLFGYHQPAQAPVEVLGSFTPVQASQFTLAGSGITSSSNTITLTSFKLPDPARTNIVMSMFGDVGYAVIEPQTNKIENISFTGVTQNANGSATLTGVSRGLSFYSPYDASTTLALSHAGGSYIILSNSGAFYGKQFLFANQIGTSTAAIVFSSTTPPRYDSVGLQAAGTYNATTSEFASLTYVNRIAVAGCATAAEGVTGCTRLSTQAQMSASTFSAGTPTALYSLYSTSSPAFGTGSYVPVTRSSDNKLSPNFLATSSADTYRWGGTSIFSGALFSSSTQNMIASTSIFMMNFSVLNATNTSPTAATSTITNLKIGNNATTTNLTVSGVCAGCFNGITQTTNTGAGPTTIAGQVTVTATCTGSKIVVGGGANSGAGTSLSVVQASYPSASNAWTGIFQGTANGTAGTVTTYAICVNP